MSFRKLLALVLALLMFTTSALAWGEKSNADAYNDAIELLQDNKFSEAADAFATIGNYEDASRLAMYCGAMAAGESGLYSVAVTSFQSLGAFRDSALLATYYAGRSYEDAQEYETAQELYSNIILFKDVSSRLVTFPEKINGRDYAKADAAEQNNRLETALSGFKALGSYSDSAVRAENIQQKIYARDYAAADTAEQNNQLETALSGFTALGSYNDSAVRAAAVQTKIAERDAAAAEAARAAAYAAADQAEQDGDYATAYTGFVELGDYQDSAARATAVQDKGNYALGMQNALAGRYNRAYEIFAELAQKNYEDSADKEYVLGVTTFASIEDKGNGIAAFKFHGLWGIINVNTSTTVSPYWDEIGSYNEHGLAYVSKNNKYGYINTQGEVIISCEWDRVSAFNGDLCTVAIAVTSPNNSNKYNYKYGLVDKTGKVVSEAQWRTLGEAYNSYWNPGSHDYNSVNCYKPVFSDGKIKVQNAEGAWGFIDTNGQMVGQIAWSEIKDFTEGLAVVYQDGVYGFIDADGNVIIQPQYDDAYSFNEGLAAVQIGGMWQFINRSNDVIIQPLYSTVNSFNSGKADVFLPGTGWQIIDSTGALLYFINEQTVTDYAAAVELMNSGSYAEAHEMFITLSGYKDSTTLAAQCADLKLEADYNAALSLMESGDYTAAYVLFSSINNYKDSTEQMAQCRANGAKISEYTVTSLGNYGFSLNQNDYYQSGNKGRSNTAALCSITFTSTTGHIYLDCINYGESGYDYGIISKLDTQLSSNAYADSSSSTIKIFSASSDSTSSVRTIEIAVPDTNSHTIYIKYIKDGSGDTGNDTLQFKVRFE